MPRLGFFGDTHGYIDDAEIILDFFKSNDVDEVISVGDWGFNLSAKVNLVYELDLMLSNRDMKMRFIDGNHDNHIVLRAFGKHESNVTENITYMHRGSIFTYDDGITIGFLGGAPSIDKRYRLENNLHWFKEEEITDDDVNEFIRNTVDKKIDIVVTHDAPKLPQTIYPIKDDIEFFNSSQASLSKVKQIVDHAKPKLLIHGHYHRYYNDKIDETIIIGLDHCGKSINACTFIYPQHFMADLSK